MKRVVFACLLMTAFMLCYSCQSAQEKSEQPESDEITEVDSLKQLVIEEEVDY